MSRTGNARSVQLFGFVEFLLLSDCLASPGGCSCLYQKHLLFCLCEFPCGIVARSLKEVVADPTSVQSWIASMATEYGMY